MVTIQIIIIVIISIIITYRYINNKLITLDWLILMIILIEVSSQPHHHHHLHPFVLHMLIQSLQQMLDSKKKFIKKTLSYSY